MSSLHQHIKQMTPMQQQQFLSQQQEMLKTMTEEVNFNLIYLN